MRHIANRQKNAFYEIWRIASFTIANPGESSKRSYSYMFSIITECKRVYAIRAGADLANKSDWEYAWTLSGWKEMHTDLHAYLFDLFVGSSPKRLWVLSGWFTSMLKIYADSFAASLFEGWFTDAVACQSGRAHTFVLYGTQDDDSLQTNAGDHIRTLCAAMLDASQTGTGFLLR